MDLVKAVLQRIGKDDLERLLSPYGYNVEMIRGTDVLHPIDGYNLIKRTARMWRNISESEEVIRDLVTSR
jgi:hypothetical protein